MKKLWITLPPWFKGLAYAAIIMLCIFLSIAPNSGFKYLEL